MPNEYQKAGVNIDNGIAAVKNISQIVKSTQDKNVISGIGGFGAEYSLANDISNLNNPVLVSGTDGVGTKLLLAIQANQHNTIGIDLVAMCANDILAQGAQPLFFLDYLGVGQLEPNKVKKIVSGIAEGCKQAGLSLIGGEMAEMPGIYQAKEDYDLSGFAVGIADHSLLLSKENVHENDILIGLSSSGIHSNGYSLVRKIIDDANLDLNKQYQEMSEKLINILLKPTKLYYNSVYPLVKSNLINAMAHITGGGIADNLSRMIPENLTAKINHGSWHVPEIFNFLQAKGKLSQHEMDQVFNQGLGMILVVDPKNLKKVINELNARNENYYEIGKVVKRNEQAVEFI
ncbi:phosphoribosylformylglycinamidine cyclo-ligase [Apilactobacillus micheneri]|uniref:Phosphoribosylformylglycinamidine cyclo-ligase n=1 Tax=Apilactobacillus micheneri TaxID=1899430 RepID=A0A9Q8MUH4_9LACO|nr:phosphoribosylformylglycinamidine cyclo-ligase [Apilactobacillus micheneri]TPR40642.1 phosphoribosylformylglycinamidine cyclo-ligase [Apilactobacillus micheneri]TPR42109.1 phosphoribosylformylglycinamidine cyclo-ligase [Apilactobacillus micheneri]TPR44764.1 phosphoribosylformylglycinamidine cyclo-ligase [Apilactobacillus micheneri]TPR45063.1 phosphoribosylformylglycinamidine cyclo-ligase [Apilactobacillus micheneri]TPR46405.1 phosphoribosylformylglycinamidine cyclo-ligase [Apilactobacillus 